MNDELTCGLFAGDRREVPLEGVRIDARVTGLATEVTVAQRYRNREDAPVEAVYVFPLDEGAAVCGLEVRIGDKVIRGRVEERDKAFEIYDDAMADGHGAFLLDQERPNVFTASVGNLRPDEAVEIRITYVALARYEGPAIRLTIPTTVSPRYVPPDAAPEVGEPDGERVNPERWYEVPYGLELKVEVDAGGPIRSVDSPSHPVKTTVRDDGARVELSRRQAALDRDFVLLVETAEPHRPNATIACEDRAGDDGGEAVARVCALTFHPDFGDREAGASEVLFLLDCSGSMMGDSIAQAKRALALSIRALEEGDTFNVVRFGSTFKSLWRRPRPYGERTLEEATRAIEQAGADLGGTEIMAPLTKLLQLRRDRDRRRQILLLTDGEVTNEHEIVELAAEHGESARIFTFGIGAGSSEYLVRELARVTRGAAEFIFPGERIEPKVLRTFGRVRSPGLDDVRIDWGGLEVEQAPASVPPVFAGDCLTVFGRVRGGTAGEVSLHAGGESWRLAVDLDEAVDGGAIPALWARETIRDLERGVGRRGSAQNRSGKADRRRRRLIELGRRYGLISSATSYVAVEERPEDERVDRPAELRKIPIALTVGWGGHGSVFGGRHRAPMPVGAPPPMLTLGGAPPAATSLANLASAAVSGFADGMQKLKKPRPGAASISVMQAPAEEAAGAEIPDRLYALLMTQKADGSFRWSQVLEEWLGDAAAEIRRAADEHGEAVVATSVAVALLERDEDGRRDEWRPAVRKARKWLQRSGSVGFDVGAVLAA